MQDDLEHLSFAEWLIELNLCAVRAGYKSNQPLVHITGQLCWHSFYEEGATPHAALQIAAQNGLDFGPEYCE